MEHIEEKVSKKDRIELCAWLFSYVTTKQNILVQIINYSSFPFKSGGEKNTFSIIKYVVFWFFFFFYFFKRNFSFFSFLQKIIL